MPALNFHEQEVNEKTFLEAVNTIRKYLLFVKAFLKTEEVIELTIKQFMVSEDELLRNSLTKEELDDYQGHYEYEDYLERLRKEVLTESPIGVEGDDKFETESKEKHFEE